MVEHPSGDATTTLYLEATQPSLYPLGVLTSIVDTFINGGTTTEWMTQHLGTKVDNVAGENVHQMVKEVAKVALVILVSKVNLV